MTADQWLQEKGTRVSFSKEEIKDYVEKTDTEEDSKTATASPMAESSQIPWSPAEELIAQHVHKKQKGSSWVRKVAFCIAAVSGLIAIFHSLSDSLASLGRGSKQGSSLLPCVGKQHAC